MLLGKDVKFVKVAFSRDDELESLVFENSDLLFGPYASPPQAKDLDHRRCQYRTRWHRDRPSGPSLVSRRGRASSPRHVGAYHPSGGEYWRRVLKAGLPKPGEEVFMTWGPKGKPKQRFTAMVREDHPEVEGQVYSPSAAAVVCMQKGGSSRQNANGWLVWKNSAGVLLSDLYAQLPEEK